MKDSSTFKKVATGIGSALLTGLVVLGKCVCDCVLEENGPGKDYPMPDLKEDYHPHKIGGNYNDD